MLGVGIDLVENGRMKEALEKWGDAFKKKVFLPGEWAYCDGKAQAWHHYAGRFAVKEAVSKAFGTGVSEHIGWLDIEVIRDPKTGAPSVRLSEKGRRLARRKKVSDVLVSLSHTRSYAVAQALLVSGGPARRTGRRTKSGR